MAYLKALGSSPFRATIIFTRTLSTIKKTEKEKNLQKKLREKTPIGKLDELEAGKHPHQEKEPLTPWPNNVNPNTGEVGGPRGPEPTRYGDWERKGRVTDF
ncbi:succinate dehydrogenase assembly factor 4, mitochondrial-like [Hetaerina americana]|uniref:succinate dehydrogenase assembly factor 4, mitochondrial-like n=1 Tax=Hetaerina americana TaxID=62018 RepID=UPI003A7F194D